MAGKYNFIIEQGASFYRKITWTDSSGSNIDLTGYSAKLNIKPIIGGNIMLELSSDNGDIILSPGGVIEVKIDASKTSNMTSKGVYNLKLINPLGNTIRLLEGTVTVSLEV